MALKYDWKFWRRPKQNIRKLKKRKVAVESGRGFGKTKLGSEWIREAVENRQPGSRIMIVGPTYTDVQETMIEGESGILSCIPHWIKYKYHKSKLKITFDGTGIQIRGFSADTPDRIRGTNITDIWGDEYGAWEPGKDVKAYKNICMALRSGRKTRLLLTSTPSFSELCDQLMEEYTARPDKFGWVDGDTYENSANLDEDFIDDIGIFEGSDWGEMEIHGRRLGKRKGALWSDSDIIFADPDQFGIVEIVAFIDAANSNTKDSDETGIIVEGRNREGRVIVLGDYSAKGAEPGVILGQLAKIRKDFPTCTTIIAERNTLGLMALHTIRNSGQGWRTVKDIYNTKKKRLRCEPCVPLCTQGMVVFSSKANLKLLCKQLVTQPIGDKHAQDDRADAMALGIHHFLPNLLRLKLKTNPMMGRIVV